MSLPAPQQLPHCKALTGVELCVQRLLILTVLSPPAFPTKSDCFLLLAAFSPLSSWSNRWVLQSKEGEKGRQGRKGRALKEPWKKMSGRFMGHREAAGGEELLWQ